MTPKQIGDRPAHPALEIDHGKVVHHQGMTIRQYYKAAALQGLLANSATKTVKGGDSQRGISIRTGGRFNSRCRTGRGRSAGGAGMNAPERIYIGNGGNTSYAGGVFTPNPVMDDDIAYIRSDLVPEWRPIAEAPRDGTEIILRCENGEIHNAGWVNYMADYPWESAEERYPVNYFTHWMPLPSAPPQKGNG